MLLSDLRNKKTAIWGLGKEGGSVKSLLPDAAVIGKEFGNENLGALLAAEVVVKSPGVSKYHPLLLKAKEQGVIVTTATNIFVAECRAPVMIAVSGTKGKSTTASLVYHGLIKAGKKALLGGNIGKPLLELLPEAADADYIVAELSSYQCADLDGFFDHAILLNLYPEHIDWHGSHRRYYQDKLNLLNFVRNRPLVNAADERIASMLKGDAIYFNNGEAAEIEPQDVNVTGRHNYENFLGVMALFRQLGIVAPKDAFRDFKPLPHRLETFLIKDGARYVDDSISTTPETTIAALRAFLPAKITVLVGGYDRQQDYGRLAAFINAGDIAAVCMDSTGKRILPLLKNAFYEETLAKAVKRAQSLDGEVVLLSPAAPSYGAFKNFEERGRRFKELVGKEPT